MNTLRSRLAIVVILITAVFLILYTGSRALAAPNATHDVCGSINVDTVWTSGGSPYVLTCNVIVSDSVTLTVNPGVTVQSQNNLVLLVEGTMNAIGTPTNPITFTSSAELGAGDWVGVRFNGYADRDGYGTLNYVTVRNGGEKYTENSAGVGIKHTAHVTISNSTIENTGGTGIYVEDGAVLIEHTTVRNNSDAGISGALGGEMTVQNCEFTDNGKYPIRVEARYTNNLTDNIFTSNEHDRVYVYTSLTDSNRKVSRNSTWSNSNQPAIYEMSNTLEVVDNITLTVQPDVTMLFTDSQGIIVYGSVTAVGTMTRPITFTSVISGAGQWGGLRFNGNGDDDGHGNLSYVTISNGGDYLDLSSSNLGIKHTDSFTISHSVIENSRKDGIYTADSAVYFEDTHIYNNVRHGLEIVDGSQGTITSCQFRNNGEHGINIYDGAVNLTISNTQLISNTANGINYGSDSNGSVTVHYSKFDGNGGNGITNDNPSRCLDATYNDWGDDDGPNDVSAVDDGCVGAVANASGGDTVSNDVYYYPWLQTGTNDVRQLWSLTEVVTGTARANEVLSYTISISNSFPAALKNVTLTAGIPVHTTFITGTDSPSADDSTPMLWNGLSVSGLQQYQFTVRIDSDAGGETLTNQACVQLAGQGDLCTGSSVWVKPAYYIYLPMVVR